MRLYVYCYDSGDPNPKVLRSEFDNVPSGYSSTDIKDAWERREAQRRLTRGTPERFEYLAHEEYDSYLRHKDLYKDKLGRSLSTDDIRKLCEGRVVALGGRIPWKATLYNTGDGPVVKPGTRIVDHITGREKPAPDLPHEVWNNRPINTDAAMELVRLMAAGEARKRVE